MWVILRVADAAVAFERAGGLAVLLGAAYSTMAIAAVVGRPHVARVLADFVVLLAKWGWPKRKASSCAHGGSGEHVSCKRRRGAYESAY